MEKKCVFCKERIDSESPLRLEENKMFMLEILMEQTSFDKELFIDCPICEDCDKTILNFFNFKSKFMEAEDEFLSYVNSDNKLDLYNVLVTRGKLKRFPNENVPIKVCRTCFKATQVQDYKQIKSLESSLAQMVTTCLPEFNVNLTENIYFCPWCYSSVLQYYNFFVLCSEVTKSRKRASTELSRDPLALNNDEPQEKKQKLEANLLINESDELSSSSSSLLVPVEPKKRGPGRPRKGEEVSKPGVPRNKIFKKRGPKKKKDTDTAYNYYLVSEMTASLGAKIDSYECQVCPAVYQTASAMEEHLSFHKKHLEYSCWKCGVLASSLGVLRNHLSMIHGLGLWRIVPAKESGEADKPVSINNTSLDQTSTSTSNAKTSDGTVASNDEARHTRLQQSFNNTQQNKKGTSSTSNSSGNNSFRKPTPDEEYYECQICPKVFDTVSSLKHHLLTHKIQSRVVCWKCRIIIKDQSLTSLKTHFKSHGFKNIYKVINSKTDHPADFIEDLLTDTEDAGGTLPLPSKPTSSTSCLTCKQKFTDIDEYLNHSCNLKHTGPTKTYEQEKDNKTERQEFGCGHCSAVFYSLDDLDEHNCISSTTTSDGLGSEEDPLNEKGKSDTNKVNFVVGRAEHIKPKHQTSPIPRTGSSSKNNESEYECSYCLLTFPTITGLDKHACKGEPQSVPSPAKRSLDTPTTVKKEIIMECAYCSSLFESALELDQHKCSSKPSKVLPFCRETIEIVDDGLNKLIKSEPEYDEFLTPDSTIDLGRNSSKEQVNEKIFHDTSGEKETLKKSTAKPQINKKVLINKIANMFGVNIVEGKDRNKDENAVKKINCAGCDFTTTDEKDLLFHFNCCVKVIKCNYCNFGTNISQKLEIHTWVVHNILIYACPYCSFTTSMEENYELHLLTHEEFRSDNNRKGNIFELDVQDKEDNQGAKNPNLDLNNEDTLSAASILPDDSNESMEDAVAFEIARPDPEVSSGDVTEATATSEHDPLATEPVWLIESSSLKKNLVPEVEQSGDTLVPEESNLGQNQNELIIPDSIISEDPLLNNVKMEPSNVDVDPLKNQSTLPSNGPNAPVIINCDSDSDNEFVESSQSRIFNVASLAEDICTISASEASQLISQGVPVVSKSSLATLHIDSTSAVTEDTTDNSAVLGTGLQKQNLSLSSQSDLAQSLKHLENNQQNAVNQSEEGSSTKHIHTDQQSTQINHTNSLNTVSSPAESTKQISSSANDSNSAIKDGENEAKDENRRIPTSKDTGNKKNENSFVMNKNISTNKENNEKVEDSDGSSFFVTDNEDSDIDNDEIPKKTSPTSTNPETVFETLTDTIKSKNYCSKIQGEKPFLPDFSPENDVSLVISDEEDNIVDKIGEEQTSVVDDTRNDTITQSAKNRLTKPVCGQTPDTDVQTANSNILSGITAKQSAVLAENSFVISDDDDDGIVNDKTSKVSSGTIEGSAFKIIKHTCTKKNYFQAVPNKNIVKKNIGAVPAPNSQPENQNNLAPSLEKLVAAKIIKDSVVVIDDNDNGNVTSDTVANDKVDCDKEDKTKEPKSRNNSTSSSLILEIDFSQEDADKCIEEANRDFGDDCVFVSEDISQSKDQGSSGTNVNSASVGKNKPGVGHKPLKLPPSAFNLFMSKVKDEIKLNYPTLKKGSQRNLILDAWRNMSSTEKWPFKEEARLLKLLFYREHPELVPRKKTKKVQKTAAVAPRSLSPPLSVSEDIEEILSD